MGLGPLLSGAAPSLLPMASRCHIGCIGDRSPGLNRARPIAQPLPGMLLALARALRGSLSSRWPACSAAVQLLILSMEPLHHYRDTPTEHRARPLAPCSVGGGELVLRSVRQPPARWTEY